MNKMCQSEILQEIKKEFKNIIDVISTRELVTNSLLRRRTKALLLILDGEVNNEEMCLNDASEMECA